MTRRTLAVSMVAVWMCSTVSAHGAEPAAAESDQTAQVVVLENCPFTDKTKTQAEAGSEDKESVGALAAGTFLAGLAGDAVGAIGNAVGSALEEASRAKAYHASGTTQFLFYRVDGPEGPKGARISPTLRPFGSKCLVLSYKAPGSSRGAKESFDIGKLGGDAVSGKAAWTNAGLPAEPTLYVEAELLKRRDGFVVRPVLVWYRKPLPGAPRKVLGAELHAVFATPASPSDETPIGTVFAAVRIELPPLTLGEPLTADQLRGIGNLVIPFRPTTGSPDDLKSSITSAYAARDANTATIAGLERSIAVGTCKLKEPNLEEKCYWPKVKAENKDELETSIGDLREQLDGEKAKSGILQTRIDGIEKLTTDQRLTGSTNIQFRFAVERKANALGLAIAESLKGRSKTLGEQLTTAWTPKEKPPRASEWGTDRTAFTQAKSTVATAERMLAKARASGDADAIFLAEQQLWIAKVQANAAAGPAKQDPPFPDVQ